MFSHARAAAFALLAATIPPTADAADRRGHPADADAPVPATVYQSAFAGYRSGGTEEKIDWRRANDAVRETGGHAGALKDAPASPAVPAPDSPRHHGSMRMQHDHPASHGQGGRQP